MEVVIKYRKNIMKNKVTKRQLERYPKYLIYLKQLNSEGIEKVSSRVIAEAFDCSEEQVRKDFQAISHEKGTPRSGRNVKSMIDRYMSDRLIIFVKLLSVKLPNMIIIIGIHK